MAFVDYYQALGLANDAEPADIKKAYRKLARKYHPDISKEADATERMKEINEAYAVLSDPDKRREYDLVLAHGGADHDGPADQHWADGGDATGPEFSDFFNNLFGQGAPGRQGRGVHLRGEDLHGQVEVPLAEVYHGGEVELSLRVPVMEDDGRMRSRTQVLKVRVPKGVREGQQLRMRGQGGPGVGSAPAGDLYLEVRYRPEPGLKVEGLDVYQALKVAPWEAALGATIQTATPAGRVEVTVPPGSQPGRRLRLKGKGIPAAPTPGNLYLVLEVVLPVPATAAQRAVYEEMARAMPIRPRQPMESQA